jgi:hypothetical protein
MPTLKTQEKAALEARLHELRDRDRQRYEQRCRNARAVYKAVEGLEASPAAKFAQQCGRVEGLAVEDRLRRLAEQLLPLLDRANKMMIRNLKAMRELRRGPIPTVVNRADQVNVAEQQANTVLR